MEKFCLPHSLDIPFIDTMIPSIEEANLSFIFRNPHYDTIIFLYTTSMISLEFFSERMCREKFLEWIFCKRPENIRDKNTYMSREDFIVIAECIRWSNFPDHR